MKVVVFTLGCKVNECESDALIEGLLEMGYEVSDKLTKADLYIVNTCAVTSEAEKKSRQTASRIKRLNPNARIIYTGCATQKDFKPFLEKENCSLITGVFSKGEILSHLKDSGVMISQPKTEYEELFSVKTLKKRTYIKVQDGCDNFCSYCIIPYLRGRNRSRNPQNVLSEIEAVKPLEVVINGINLSAYNYEGEDLTSLINKLKCVSCRLRLGSLEVRIITEEFLIALKGLKNFAPHFHLSLQSGSNRVLKKMNRKYTREEYLEKVNLIRQFFPDAGITTDIIAGFPTETEEDFLDTIDLIDKVKFSDIHPFMFSPRSGTVASNMPKKDKKIKKQRLDKLLEKKAECKKTFIEKEKGKICEFLFEEEKNGFKEGYSENYIRLYVEGEVNIDGFTKVEISEQYLDGAKAKVIF